MAGKEMPITLKELLSDLDRQGIHDARRYAAVRKYLCFKARDKNLPISGSFELTPLCNFDCKMCYVHLQKEQLQGKKLLTAGQWQDIMRQAIDGGMMYATLTGGECLTYPDFKSLYLFLRNNGIEVNVLSNGALMDEEMTAFLCGHPPSRIQITLYGASEDAYERVTGKRAFHIVLENIRRLNAAGLPLQIAVTPNAFMTDGESVVRLLHEEGLPFIINAGLLKPREETGRKLLDANIDAYIAMNRLNLSLKGQIADAECDDSAMPLPATSPERKAPAKGVRCGAGRSTFSVDWQGAMRPCNNFPCEPESVLSLGFAEAWRRINQTAREFQRPMECESCGYREVCKHCIAEHASGAPIGHASPAVCAWGKKMVAAGLLTLRQPEQ